MYGKIAVFRFLSESVYTLMVRRELLNEWNVV